MKKKSLSLFKILLLFSFPFNISAADWYVDDTSNSNDVYTIGSANGNDGAVGTALAPFATLAQAISSASNGDTIFVDAGNYNQVSVNINKSVSIIGASSGITVFTGNASINRFGSITANNVTIKNIKFINYYLNNNGQVMTMTGRTGIIFENIVVKDNQGAPSDGVNFELINSTVTFKACLFSCSGWNADGGGTILANNTNLTLQNCAFKEVKNFASSGRGGAVEMIGANPVVTIFETVFEDCSSTLGGAIFQNSGTLTVDNSCFFNNYTQGNSSDPLLGGGAYANVSSGATTSASFTNCNFTDNFVNPITVQFDSNASCDGGCFLFRSAGGTYTFDKCSFDNLQPGAAGRYDRGQDFFLDESAAMTLSITNSSFGPSTNASGGNKVNINNNDLEAADLTITNSGSFTFTGAAAAVTDGNAPVWDATFSAPNTNCIDVSNIAACGATIDCGAETLTPIIISCVPDQTILDCSAILDYTLLVSAFDDCSFTVTQSPAAGTILANGTHPITMTVTDAAGNTSTCIFNITVSGCVACVDPGPPAGDASQEFCIINNPTLNNIVVVGDNILWYDAAVGGNLLPGTTVLLSGTSYFASQTVVATCESADRWEVVIGEIIGFSSFASATQIKAFGTPTIYNTTGSGADCINQACAVVLNGTNLGTYDQNSGDLQISGAEIKTRKSTGNVCSGTMSYRVYKIGDVPGSFIDVNLPFANSCVAGIFNDGLGPCSPNDQKWKDYSFAIDLTDGICEGNYNLEVSYSYTGSNCSAGGCSEEKFVNNSGLFYVANFSINATPAPTANATQSFCTIDNPTVADLTTLTGTNIQWYDAAVNGNLLPSGTTLLNGTSYFASQTEGSCESALRVEVVATVENPSAPTANAAQSFCTIDNPTVADLTTLTGTNIQWYDAAVNGNLLPSGTTLVNGTSYFASQTEGSCESALRVEVVVNISNPSAPAGNPSQLFCVEDNPTVADLQATGSNIQWYLTVPIETILNSSTPLVNGISYFASQTVDGCEGVNLLQIDVTINTVTLAINSINEPTCGESEGSISVIASGGNSPYTYTWSNGIVSDEINSIPGGQYTVNVLDVNGCSASLTKLVDCILPEIPEIITPGGNGKNETWVIGLYTIYPEMTVKIFNRWGNEVFTASPYLDDWAGKCNTGIKMGDEFLPNGTYFYLIDLKNGDKPLSGYIELVR